MRVGLIELDIPNHYLAVNAVAKVYAADEQSQVTIFTTQAIHDLLVPMCKRDENITIQVTDPKRWEECLHKVKDQNFDRVHFISLYSNLDLVRNTDFGCPVYLGIHNVNYWTGGTLGILNAAWKKSGISFDRHVLYKLRKVFPQEVKELFSRKKLLDDHLTSKGKVVVYGANVKREVIKSIDPKKVTMIPFSVYDQGTDHTDEKGEGIHICVTGTVTQKRRDYFSLFKAIEDNSTLLKDLLTLELLGKLDTESEEYGFIQRLIEKGLNVIYYENYLDESSFIRRLNSCHLILGNINMQESYGKFTETGILFNMIRAAKPGLIPLGFPNFEELQTSTLTFKQYDEVIEMIMNMSKDPKILVDLNVAAKGNSLKFAPQRFMNQLFE